jgi:hypothetical protein
MLDEIRKITKYLMHEPRYIDLRKKILVILAIFIALIFANRFLVIQAADKGAFFISLARVKEIFWGSSSVYTKEIAPAATELSRLGIRNLTHGVFKLPLYALVFYLPFSFIRDFNWSLALWLAANEIICYFILSVFLRIIEKKLKDAYLAAAASLLALTYFMTANILATNLSLIQLLLILLAFQKAKDNQSIFSGILLGLAFFNPYEFFIPLAIFVLLNFRNGRSLVNGWMLISTALFVLAFVIFNSRWLLELLKVVLLKPDFYPFISFNQYIHTIYPGINTRLLDLFPILLLVWIVIEWLRTPKEYYLQELWLLALGFTLAPLLNMWDKTYALTGYAFVLIFTTALWIDRAPSKFRTFSFAANALLLIVLPAGQMLIRHKILAPANLLIYNLVFTLILLLNLYWVRLWVINPYYSVNKLDGI